MLHPSVCPSFTPVKRNLLPGQAVGFASFAQPGSSWIRCLIVLSFLCGCGAAADPYDRQPLTGQVLFNGQPVETGAIVFYPAANGPVSAGSNIQHGEFSISKDQGLPAGEYQVSISAPDMSNPKGITAQNTMENPEGGRELLPAKYNSKTTLTCTVEKAQKNHFVFDLKSK